MKELKIEAAALQELEKLMIWRERVIREVFTIPEGIDITALLQANRTYYRSAIPQGEHVACFVRTDGATVGCGGVCFQREMPSPDNPAGLCAYLMNIYVLPAYRHQQIGRQIVGWLITRAHERGAGKIYLETSEIGRNLYHSMRFTNMENLMKL